jgi:hypothetical protein
MPTFGLQTPGRAPATSTLVVKFDPDDYLAMAEAAKELDMSMSAFVRYLVRRHIARPIRRKQLSPEAQRFLTELFAE